MHPTHTHFPSRFLPLAAALLCAMPALAQHSGDIGLVVEGGTIATHQIGAGGIGAPQRVFTATFGDAGAPYFTSNPGFDCVPGTFVPGTRVGFRFAAPLLLWDGAAFVPTDAGGPLLGERLRAAFLTANATTADGPVPGFDLAVQSNGGWHRHLSYTLLPATGAAVPEAGVYLVSLQLYSTDPAVHDSPTLLLVMNADADESVLADAVAAAEASLAPAPCDSDLNADGRVDGADLGLLLGSWGGSGAADLNGDGTVNGADLGALLGAFGDCPGA